MLKIQNAEIKMKCTIKQHVFKKPKGAFQENTNRAAFETLAGLLKHVSPSLTYLPFLSPSVTDTVNMLMMPEAL